MSIYNGSMRYIPVLFLMFFLATAAQAQVRYTIQIERPEAVTDQQIMALFRDYPDIRQVQVAGSRLVLTVPSEEDYPIGTIREILGGQKVAAIDYQSEPGTFGMAARKNLESATFQVAGNCGMCKDRIERAARSVKGVVMANWDTDTHKLMVKYLPGRTTPEQIRESVRAVGHDIDGLRADDEVYRSLHTCCQYERTPKSDR